VWCFVYRLDESLSQKIQSSLLELESGLHRTLVHKGVKSEQAGRHVGKAGLFARVAYMSRSNVYQPKVCPWFIMSSNGGMCLRGVGESESDVSGIETLMDEMQYWNDESKKGGHSGSKLAVAASPFPHLRLFQAVHNILYPSLKSRFRLFALLWRC
jgi:hypothetical protein